MPEHRMTTVGEILSFMLAGNATLTLKSVATGKHYTYKVKRAKPWSSDGANPPLRWWVDILSGPDNTADYSPLGMLKQAHQGVLSFGKTSRSCLADTAPPMAGFAWFIRAVVNEDAEKLAQVEFWHEGRCGKCNRKLTDPTSIRLGIGPVCRGDS